MEFLAKVYVTPKAAVLDPQGKAIAASLGSLGFDEVSDVRLGKYIELRFAADTAEAAGSRIDDMCRQLLANEVIEEYRFEIEADER